MKSRDLIDQDLACGLGRNAVNAHFNTIKAKDNSPQPRKQDKKSVSKQMDQKLNSQPFLSPFLRLPSELRIKILGILFDRPSVLYRWH